MWQNLIVSDIDAKDIDAAKVAIEALGLSWKANSIRAGLIACTGNTGCKFAASDTKGHALQIADHVESRVAMDQPVNIHLTGCHHSCAQHYIGDIGLIGAKVAEGEEEIEGYHVHVGGGYGEEQALARELFRDVKATRCAEDDRAHADGVSRAACDAAETFHQFTKRQSLEQLHAGVQRGRGGGMMALAAGERAVLAATAGLAEWIFCRLARAGADDRLARRHHRPQHLMPKKKSTRPGTTPRWR